MASTQTLISRLVKKPKISIIPLRKLFIDLTEDDSKTPSPQQQPKSPNEPDEVYFAFGRHLEELHVTWAHLEKKRTRLWTYTNITQDNVLSSWRRRHHYNVTSSQQRPRRHHWISRRCQNLGSIIDSGLSEVVLGQPFAHTSKLTYNESLGLIRFSQRDNEVVFRMPQRTKELDQVSPLEKDKFEAFFVDSLKVRKIGFKHVLEMRKGY
ncbi:hypothetical protein Tco_1301032 [Tanacetum coccineum]